MNNLKRTNINYSKYSNDDKKALEKIDPTPGDSSLTSSDLKSLKTDQLDQVYKIYRSYSLSSNGFSSHPISAKDVSTFIQKNGIKPIDYIKAACKNNKYLLFGESHNSPKSRSFMASMIPVLKSQGVTDFAIEVPHQKRGIIEKFMKTGNKQLLKEFSWMDSEYIQMLDSARQEGLQVICIDDVRYKGRNRGKVDSIMFQNLQAQVGEGKRKVAIYIGENHVSETQLLSFVQNGRFVEKPNKVGQLGYYLESKYPGKSHSIILSDRSDAGSNSLGKGNSGDLAISTDHPFLHSIVDDEGFNATYGGSFDGLIILNKGVTEQN